MILNKINSSPETMVTGSQWGDIFKVLTGKTNTHKQTKLKNNLKP